ncbi:GNAT family protein [Maricaulis sp.]|uniref:GNAT family N-acetyltransferase n=1 Tax=Maricaulis sp. TaxID=1486257 RepID=UPI002B267CF5|nr:GNAT family protein [Maricaulis sp.]
MTSAVLYRWKLKPGRAAEFEAAWAEGTLLIHDACGSYGAALHKGEDRLYWSYAAWPNEEARSACFSEHDWFSRDCFITMQACIETRFDEIRLDLVHDALSDRAPPCATPVLSTRRLLLRPLVPDDAEALFPALGDPDTMTYWSRPAFTTVAAARAHLVTSTRSASVRTWAICRPSDPGDALGWVVLMDRKDGVAETGYIIRPDARRAGIVSEAVSRILAYGFGELGLRRIYADTDPDNCGSIAVLKKLGFTLEGRLRGQWNTHLGIRDSLIFGRLAAEWQGGGDNGPVAIENGKS